MALKDFFSLDIGHSNIRIVQFSSGGDMKTYNFINAFEYPSPKSSIESENKSQKTALAKAIKEAVKESGIKTKNCVISIPENNVSSRLLKIPYVDEKQLDQAIYWQAKQYIPIPVENVNLSYRRVAEIVEDGKDQNWLIFLVAVPKTTIDYYVSLLAEADLNTVAIETGAAAIGRNISRSVDASPAFIVDLGSDTTTAAVLSHNEVIFSQSIPIGSSSITKAIANEFSLETKQAEEYKKNYGLNRSEFDGRIFNVVHPIVESIVNELNRSINYFKLNSPEDTPQKIIMVGNGALLPGLVLYMTEATGIEVQLGAPWEKISGSVEAKTYNFSIGFSKAIGLAMKADEL